MKLLISFGLGFIGLGAAMMVLMGGVFAAGAMANENSGNAPFADIFMYACAFAALLSLPLFAYGQYLLWTNAYETYWIPSLFIGNGLIIMAFMVLAVFFILPK